MRYHFIGIKGSGMASLAEIIADRGDEVTGSDIEKYIFTQKPLEERGIKITSFDEKNIQDGDTVIIGLAFDETNPEVKKALSMPTVKTYWYNEFLGELLTHYNSISVAGTHGKTTTTSMISCCFLKANMDPNIQVGALLKEIDGNYRVGNSEYFILEACEYVESFLKFYPKAEVILNIDNDHLDYFKTFDNIKNAFIKYVNLLPKDGVLVLNADDPNCLDLRKHSAASSITYGINNEYANYIAKNISFNKNGECVDIIN